MSLIEIHARLSSTAALFVAVLALWALWLRIRSRPLDGNWFGAAVVGELLLVGEALLGVYLYLQGGGTALPRPLLHTLYGIVAVITLPAAYGYFHSLEDENVKTLAMAATCAFLWGIVLRAGQVVQAGSPAL